MRLVEGDIKKKGLRFVAKAGQPFHRFARNDAAGISGDWALRDSVSHEIVGIVMVRQGVVVHGEPVIETKIIGLRLAGQVEKTVEMPFPHLRRGVAGAFQQRAGLLQ